MPPAPVVQSLQDLVGQYTAAQAPEVAQDNASIASNEASGSAQVSGLQAQEAGAFSKIGNEANARGATFSGFTPSQEASYTGSTYLPALAKLQSTIAATRGQLLGDEATLSTSANTNALGEQKTEQGQLDTYNDQVASEQAELQRQNAEEAFEAQQNAASRAATASEDSQNRAAEESDANASASASAAKEAQETYLADVSSATSKLSKETGSDGYVSPQSYDTAVQALIGQGYSSAQASNALSSYKNPSNKNYKY